MPDCAARRDKEQYNALIDSLAEAFLPQGPIEWMYLTQIAGHMTRLKRVDIAEHAVIGRQVVAVAEELGDDGRDCFSVIALRTVLSTIARQQNGSYPVNDFAGRMSVGSAKGW